MSDKLDPTLGNGDSILDEINAESAPIEEVAAPAQKTNPIRLLTNKNNKKLLLLFFVVVSLGIAIVLFSILSLDDEVSNQPPLKIGADNTRELPQGEQTTARIEEINRYNEENLNGVNQPIALENQAIETAEVLDGSFASDAQENEIAPCPLDDTACMRLKELIAPDGCAPQDVVCLTAIQQRSQGKSTASGVPAEPTREEKLLKRFQSDPEYVKALSGLLKSAVDGKKTLVVVSGGVVDHPEEPKPSSNDQNPPAASTIDGGILKPAETMVELLISSGDRLMGAADIALNSQIEGEASFTVFGGQFIESRMLGSVKRVDNYMRVELDTWVLPDKRECRIQAVALDKKTTYAAIASRVDHHVIYRYGWWGLGTVLSAIGAAAEANAKRDVVVVDSTVIESTESDSKREVRMAAGNLGEEIGKVMQKRIDRPSTVYVDLNETVGIFFMAPVTTGDCKFGGYDNVKRSAATLDEE